MSDHGPGIPAEISDTLFDRFGGRNTQGGNSGLGLHFCRVSVQRWGGKIRVVDEYTDGACLEIELRSFQG